MCLKKSLPFCGPYQKTAEGEFKMGKRLILEGQDRYCLQLRQGNIQLCSSEDSGEVVVISGTRTVPNQDYAFQFEKAPVIDLASYYDDYYELEEETGENVVNF